MPWCPKCKSEYREGFTICADCGSELVEELPAEKAVNDFQDGQSEEYMVRGAGESEAEETIREALDNPQMQESVLDLVKKLQGEETRKSVSAGVYQDSSEKANDNKSSAWMLLILGIAGLIVVILGTTKILPINFGNSYLFYGVMGAIFILFVVGGIVSMKNAKFFEKKAESENTLKNTLLDWCKENLDAKEIDSNVCAGGESEEILYFKRMSYIKAKLNHQFVNLDQGFLDRLIDDYIFDDIFGE